MLFADHLHGTTQLLHALLKPGQFLTADAVMLRVPRLHIRFLELFEESAIGAGVTRPRINQARIDALRLGAEKAEIVDVWRVKSAYKQNAVLKALGSLVHQKSSVLKSALRCTEFRGFHHSHGGRKPFSEILLRHSQRLLRRLRLGLVEFGAIALV